MVKFFKFLLLVLFFILFTPSMAQIQLYQLYNEVNLLRAQIKIKENGQVLVSQTFFLASPSSDFIYNLEGSPLKLSVRSGNQELTRDRLNISKLNGKTTIRASSHSPAEIWQISYMLPSAVTPTKRDNLFIVLIYQPGVYIKTMKAEVILPKEINPKEINPRIYAVHGVGESFFSILDSKTLLFTGKELMPQSTYTISASWPKGIIKYPAFKRLSFVLKSWAPYLWFLVFLGLPFFSLLFYLYMLFLRKRDERLSSPSIVSHPPETLPPAVVGILFRESASEREIASTILDLAQRGYLEIIKKREEYILIRRKNKEGLRPFEAYLYDKLFMDQNEIKVKRTEFELEQLPKRQLVSLRITHFFEALYREVRKRDYFIKNPQSTIFRYKAIGVIFFLLAILSSFLVIIFSQGPPYGLFGCVGQVLASFLIIKTASFLPHRTREGREALKRWLAFKNFLEDKTPLPSSFYSLFEKYLPYAVAFGKEIEWTSRFSQAVYVPPSWFTADEEITLENFVASVFYVIGEISRAFYELKEPGA